MYADLFCCVVYPVFLDYSLHTAGSQRSLLNETAWDKNETAVDKSKDTEWRESEGLI